MATVLGRLGKPGIFAFSEYGISHVYKMAVRMERLLYFILVVVVFQCLEVQIASAVACTFMTGSTCKCTLATGGQIDLSPLFAGGGLSVQGTGKEYVPR